MINKIINGDYDKEFAITSENMRYEAIVNVLLQIIFIIGHLHSSSLELFHGNYIPDTVYVKKCSVHDIKYYKFNVYGHKINIKNMGFAVIIDYFTFSSISINSDINLKYRLIPPIVSSFFLSKYVNNLITGLGDVGNSDYEPNINIHKVYISKLTALSKDPTINILRSAGITLYKDLDIYTFMVQLLDDITIRDYIISKKLDTIVLSFMSKQFKTNILNKLPKSKSSINETTYIIVDIFYKIKEPMYKVFTDDYFNLLKNLNYKLFKL